MAPYRRSAVGSLVALLVACAIALVTNDEGLDTGLGAVAGASTVLLLGCLLGIAVERRRRRADADAASLDRLEPLHSAQRDHA